MKNTQNRWMKNIVKTSAKSDVDLPWTRQARALKRNARKNKRFTAQI